MKQTQVERIKKRLLEKGYVTRNEALQNFISRLGAIICDLEKDGWTFESEYIKIPNGKDYKYTLKSAPVKKIVYHVPDLGKTIETYQ